MEEQGLVVVKDNFIVKLTNTVRRFFFKGKMKDYAAERADIAQLITKESDYVQQEILNARRAFRKYTINNTNNISNDILDYTLQKIEENEQQIKQIIDINEDDITYEEIIEMLNGEKVRIKKFKNKSKTTGAYRFPVGVIGIECSNARESISYMFKAISSRNAIIILHDNYNKYSTESLIMLIVKECFKNFYVDDNIVQMFQKEEIDLKKLNKFISRNEVSDNHKKCANSIYIYQDNDMFSEDVKKEVERLQSNEIYKSYDIRPIKGEFGNIVNYLSSNKASAVCMYTDNKQRAYKLLNWIDSPNIFINSEVSDCKNFEENHNVFYGSKYIVRKDVL